MARGYYLIVGVSQPSPSSGWQAKRLRGVPHDVVNMSNFLNQRGLEALVEPPQDDAAEHDVVLEELRSAARRCRPGDLFVFYYSGHGAEQDGATAAEQEDQLLLTYDKPIVDNELAEIWPTFSKDVRIVVITDSCHSGTVTRGAMRTAGRWRVPSIGVKSLTSRTIDSHSDGRTTRSGETRGADETGFEGTLLHLAACRDSQEAEDVGIGGAFTVALLNSWKPNSSYLGLSDRVAEEMPNGQENQLNVYGAWKTMIKEQFAFTVDTRWPPTREVRI